MTCEILWAFLLNKSYNFHVSIEKLAVSLLSLTLLSPLQPSGPWPSKVVVATHSYSESSFFNCYSACLKVLSFILITCPTHLKPVILTFDSWRILCSSFIMSLPPFAVFKIRPCNLLSTLLPNTPSIFLHFTHSP